jgi:hypothetical protein
VSECLNVSMSDCLNANVFLMTRDLNFNPPGESKKTPKNHASLRHQLLVPECVLRFWVDF